jgi:hypothetical protein
MSIGNGNSTFYFQDVLNILEIGIVINGMDKVFLYGQVGDRYEGYYKDNFGHGNGTFYHLDRQKYIEQVRFFFNENIFFKEIVFFSLNID